jgi:uncharacterized protein (DUF736 family)
MDKYDDRNTLVMFANEKKHDKMPDYKGTLTDENGKKWELALWERTSKKGASFLSGKISEPYVKPEGTGYDSFKQAGEKFKKDVVLEDIDDSKEIDLSEIPF